MLAIIVAMDNNNLIGSDNKLPWHLPADLQYFKQTTLGSSVVMGRKTFDSIVAMIGKPLPGRENIILSRDTRLNIPGCRVINDIGEIKKLKKLDNAFIIGGSNIYTQTIDIVDKIYITQIDDEFNGDAYFPTIDTKKWQVLSEEKHLKDEKNAYDYSFKILGKQ